MIRVLAHEDPRMNVPLAQLVLHLYDDFIFLHKMDGAGSAASFLYVTS